MQRLMATCCRTDGHPACEPCPRARAAESASFDYYKETLVSETRWKTAPALVVQVDVAALTVPRERGGETNYGVCDLVRTMRLIANADVFEDNGQPTYRSKILTEVAAQIDAQLPKSARDWRDGDVVQTTGYTFARDNGEWSGNGTKTTWDDAMMTAYAKASKSLVLRYQAGEPA